MHRVCRVRNLVNNRTGTSCQVCVQFCFVRRLLVLLPNFVVVVEHIKFWGNHSFWPSNIADIVRDGRNIMWWCQNSYIFPRDNIFPQCWALRRKYNPFGKYNSLGSSPKRDISWPSRSISVYHFKRDLLVLWESGSRCM